MKQEREVTNLIKNAETLGTVHTCGFIGKFRAIFAFINNVRKGQFMNKFHRLFFCCL